MPTPLLLTNNSKIKEGYMPDIKLMNNTANFADATVRSTNVSELKEELSIPHNSTINVNGVIANNSTVLEDGQYIAIVTDNKTGGKGK